MTNSWSQGCCCPSGPTEICDDCDCSSNPGLFGSGQWSPCEACTYAHGPAHAQYVVCITEEIQSCTGANAPVVAPPAVGTKIFIETDRGCMPGKCCRYINDVTPPTPELWVRFFMPPATGGKFEIDIYYPFTSGVYDYYFHAELNKFPGIGGGGSFKCNDCNIINNELVAGDCGGQGKGSFASHIYKTTGYGGQIMISPCIRTATYTP